MYGGREGCEQLHSSTAKESRRSFLKSIRSFYFWSALLTQIT